MPLRRRQSIEHGDELAPRMKLTERVVHGLRVLGMERLFSSTLAAAQCRERGPDHDAVDPRGEGAVTAIVGPVLQHRDHRLLRDVVDVDVAADQIANEVTDARSELDEQGMRGGLVVGSRSGLRAGSRRKFGG